MEYQYYLIKNETIKQAYLEITIVAYKCEYNNPIPSKLRRETLWNVRIYPDSTSSLRAFKIEQLAYLQAVNRDTRGCDQVKGLFYTF